MSKELHIRDSLVYGLCAAAGLDPGSVKEIRITSAAVVYEVYMEPKQRGADDYLTVIATYPYS